MNPIQEAIDKCGGPSAVAAMLGVTVQAVCFWRDGKRKFPVEHCAVIEQATGGTVTRQELRPDDWMRIWPELAGEKREAA